MTDLQTSIAPRKITVIGVPSSAGAFANGQEDAPAALRAAGLIDRLRDAGADVAAADLFLASPLLHAARAVLSA